MTGKKAAFIVCAALVFALMLAALELNKNTIFGFVLAAIAFAGFAVLYLKVLTDHAWYLKMTGWIGWIAVFALIVVVTWPPIKAVPAVNVKNPEKTEVVALSDGKVQGVLTSYGKVEVFTGIPYAKAPVGELRWKEPQSPDKWDGVRLCDHFAPMSMQPTNVPIYDSLTQIVGYHDYKISLDDNYIPPVSEDSLYVNVWKPAGDVSDLPVLVYVHGGSLQTGQPWWQDYRGEELARRGAVVVNMAYRVGVFGFYADEELAAESENGTTGNYGLLDQIKALEWVRDNIAFFGGDAKNVTLAGESAGAASVSALCTSPLAAGLFERVFLESSTVASTEPPHSFRLFDEAIKSGAELKSRHNCDTVADLRALDAKDLVSEAYTQHHITVDGYVLTETPYESYKKGAHNEKQIMHGYNLEESAAFIIFDQANMKNYESKVRGYFKEYSDEILALYPAKTDAEAKAYWAEIFGATFFDYPHFCLDRLAVENGIPVYEYIFTKSNGRLGPWHSGEEIYFYGNVPEKSTLFTPRDSELEEQAVSYLRSYMNDGDPNVEGLPEWKQNLSGYDLMHLGETTEMTKEKKADLYKILDKLTHWGE